MDRIDLEQEFGHKTGLSFLASGRLEPRGRGHGVSRAGQRFVRGPQSLPAKRQHRSNWLVTTRPSASRSTGTPVSELNMPATPRIDRIAEFNSFDGLQEVRAGERRFRKSTKWHARSGWGVSA
jgi:hypothetical protein